MTQHDTDAGQGSAGYLYRPPAGFCGECGGPRADLSGSFCSACGAVFAGAQLLSSVGSGASSPYVAPLDYVAPPAQLRMPITGPQQAPGPWVPLHQLASGQYPVQQPVVPKKRKNAFVLLTGIVALVAVVVVAVVLTGRRSSATLTPTFSMSGSLTLIDSDSTFDSGGCQGTGGHDDIYEGTNITVYNNAGTIVGVGNLGTGIGLDSVDCFFAFSIPDVPAGQGPYQYEISHRGRLTISEADARNGDADSTLGS